MNENRIVDNVAFQYSNMTVSQMNEKKSNAVSLAIKDFFNKSNASLIQCIENYKEEEVVQFKLSHSLEFTITII